jgi:hypothetical protein
MCHPSRCWYSTGSCTKYVSFALCRITTPWGRKRCSGNGSRTRQQADVSCHLYDPAALSLISKLGSLYEGTTLWPCSNLSQLLYRPRHSCPHKDRFWRKLISFTRLYFTTYNRWWTGWNPFPFYFTFIKRIIICLDILISLTASAFFREVNQPTNFLVWEQ